MTTKERFLKDTAEHHMQVFQNEGLYRHLRFRKPGTMAMHFDLITWPGYLCYTGDMGTYVFSRLSDMFKFFRLDESYSNKKGVLDPIDHRYWAEKLQGVDKGDGVREFDPKAFKREIMKQRRALFVEHFREIDKDQRQDFWDSLQDVIDSADDGEGATFLAVRDWSFRVLGDKSSGFCHPNSRDIYLDTDDFPSCKAYTHRFLWCCYALRLGISLYDKAYPPC